jgi:tetratricopeptide (TPR) repeat protein
MRFEAQNEPERRIRGTLPGTLARLGAVWAALFLSVFSAYAGVGEVPSYPSPTLEQARAWYAFARSNYFNGARDATAAWKFAEACFEWAEFATNNTQRAALAGEGIEAARKAIEKAPAHAAGYFYLGMNKGQLARTRTLGALPLVKEMEKAFLQAIKLDPKFDHAASHRSLGMLYLDAPGWPASIGDKSKARQHLEKAAELVPEYPTNHLTLMKAYLRWEDSSALEEAIARYHRLLPAAKEKYSGELWENSWRNWNKDWAHVLQQAAELAE